MDRALAREQDSGKGYASISAKRSRFKGLTICVNCSSNSSDIDTNVLKKVQSIYIGVVLFNYERTYI